MKKILVLGVLIIGIIASVCCNSCGVDSSEEDSQEAISTNNPGSDADGDGYGEMEDCNEQDASINPGVEEILCNDVDENCDQDLGTQSTKLYSIGEYSGTLGISGHYFVSSFNAAVPRGNGIFTFDISGVEWTKVQKVEMNAYMVHDWPCQEGDWFFTPSYKFYTMPDDYYSYFQECPGGVYWTTDCNNPKKFGCHCFQHLWEFDIIPNYLSPIFYPNNLKQTTNWWQVNVYNEKTQHIWKDAHYMNKKYISIIPGNGSCMRPKDFYSYYTSAIAYESAGNYYNTGNVPYLEVTCQP